MFHSPKTRVKLSLVELPRMLIAASINHRRRHLLKNVLLLAI